MNDRLRIVHLSDIHVWQYPRNPLHLMNKRLWGVLDLLRGRARKFRLERLRDVVARVVELQPDHILITGDLTTTALSAEFLMAREHLRELFADPLRVSLLPGNHDRYTRGAMRNRKFEQHFGDLMPARRFPWMRWLDERTAILGLDATRSHLSARGFLPPAQMDEASALLEHQRPGRLIIANHYPVEAPEPYRRELAVKRLKNQQRVRDWLANLGPHLYCCGHVHAAWVFRPTCLPNQLCINAGAPLLRDPRGLRLPGFQLIEIEGPSVRVVHHAWDGNAWRTLVMVDEASALAAPPEA
jgi:3',5'-cyclic AMP phosphodiesterase CpdA